MISFSAKLPKSLRTRLEGRPTLSGLVDNSFWLFCDQGLRMLLGLFVGVLITRSLGPEKFGLFNFAQTIVGTMSSLTSIGADTIVVREMVRTPGAMGAWLGSAFVLKSTSSAIGFLLCTLLALTQAVPAEPVRILVIIVATGLLFQTLDVIDLLLQATAEARISAWIRISACLLANLYKIILLLSHASIRAFAVAMILETVLCGAGRLWAMRQLGWRISSCTCERFRLRLMIREGWPLALSGLAVYVQAYADQLVIGSVLGTEQLGQYSAAVRLVVAFAFVPMVIYTVAAPEITRAKQDNEVLYRKRLHDLYRLMLFAFLIAGVPLILWGAPAARLIYGPSYSGAATLLPFIGFRLFFTNFGIARGIFLTNEGLFRFGLLTAVAGAVVNIALILTLVPIWGVRGAIISSLVSFGFTTFGLEFTNHRARINLHIMILAIFQPWRKLAR